MLKKKLQISNRNGLHARAADKLVKTALHHSSEVEIICNGRHADAKSIMAVMMLGAKKGSELELEIQGEDELETFTDLEKLITDHFGEGG